jgi:hypothetical protein
MSNSSMALAVLVAAQPQEVLGAEVGVVAADVDDRRPRHTGTSRRAPGDDGADLHLVVVGEHGVARHERAGCGSRAPTRG